MRGLHWQCAACLSLLWIAGAGCMEDTKGTYRAVTDKNGELVPGDASQRSFVKAPNPDSSELIPVQPADKRGTDAGHGKATVPTDKALPKEVFGIAVYPKSQVAEGFDTGKSVISDAMRQVIHETKDPASVVDTFFAQNLPEAQRSETKIASGTGVIYLLPLKDGVSRSVAITPTTEDKTLITYGKVDDATAAAASAIAEKTSRPQPSGQKPHGRTATTLPGGAFDKPVANGIPPPPAGLASPADTKTMP